MRAMKRAIVAAALLLAAQPSSADAIADDVAADLPSLLTLYKELHAKPELAFQEVESARRVAEEARRLGFEVTTGVGKTGVVAVLRNGAGPVLMIRADMDGLPVREETGLPYASRATGKAADGSDVPTMHACGHDVHMTAWVGTARRLVALRNQWSGTLVMIAQPAEERGLGALAMLEDGLYTRFPRPTHALALHDSPALPAGMVSWTPGYALANVDSIDLTVRGVGGHGAYPHLTKDPIVLAARIVGALQTLVSRETDPLQSAVVTVGSVRAGTTYNVIPDEAKLQITVRSFEPETRERLLAGIRRIAEGEAEAAGMPADRMPVMQVQQNYTPSTFNTEVLTRTVADALTARFGRDRAVQQPKVMGGEDFSRYWLADKSIESTIFWVGATGRAAWTAAGGDVRRLPGLHSAKFAPDPEPTIRTAVEAMTTAALAVVGRRQ